MSRQICHAHCPKPGSGGVAVAAVLGIIIIAAIARPVLHTVSVVLEATVIAAASVLGLAAIGGIAFLALRAQRRQARSLHGVSQHPPIAQRDAQALSAPQRLAIEAPRPSLADIEAPRPSLADIEAPRPSLADLKALAAEHGYDVIRRED